MGQNLLNRKQTGYKLDEWDFIPTKFLFLLLRWLEPLLSITPGDSSLKIK